MTREPQCRTCGDSCKPYCAQCGESVDEEELFDRIASAGAAFDERFGGRRSIRLRRRAGGYVASWAYGEHDPRAVITIGRYLRMVDAFAELAEALEYDSIASRESMAERGAA